MSESVRARTTGSERKWGEKRDGGRHGVMCDGRESGRVGERDDGAACDGAACCMLHGAQALADEAMNAMLKNLKLPEQEKVEVTYTTRCASRASPRTPCAHVSLFVFFCSRAHARSSPLAAWRCILLRACCEPARARQAKG